MVFRHDWYPRIETYVAFIVIYFYSRIDIHESNDDAVKVNFPQYVRGRLVFLHILLLLFIAIGMSEFARIGNKLKFKPKGYIFIYSLSW
jgi:hypothetical protein